MGLGGGGHQGGGGGGLLNGHGYKWAVPIT